MNSKLKGLNNSFQGFGQKSAKCEYHYPAQRQPTLPPLLKYAEVTGISTDVLMDD